MILQLWAKQKESLLLSDRREMLSAAQQKKKSAQLHLVTIYLPPDLFLFSLEFTLWETAQAVGFSSKDGRMGGSTQTALQKAADAL